MNPLTKYVHNELIDINKEELSKLKELYDNTELFIFFNKLSLKFPYKKYYIFNEKSAEQRLQLGKTYIPIFSKEIYKNNDIKLKNKEELKQSNYDIQYPHLNMSFYEYNVISDAYTEECRIKSTIKNNKSLYDYFVDFKLRKIWLDFNNITELNTKILRDLLYYKLKGIELTNFPATVALTVYQKFKAKKILDMSSGWGDRLLAAITYDSIYNIDYYYGIDPNECLFSGYNLIKKLSKNKNKFKLINDTFEDAKINKKFDIMFSSPPYFDFEKYTTSDNQSYIRYNSVELWLTKFMYVSIKKIYDLLLPNGYLCINISDTGSIPYVEKILKYIESLDGFKYLYTYGYLRYENVYRPIYVYQKINRSK